MFARLLVVAVAGGLFATQLVGCGAAPEEGGRAGEASTPLLATIAIGDARGCAISAGKLLCFVPGESKVTPIEGLEGVVEVASGHDHVCARRDDGAVFCFGENAWGQLGDGTLGASVAPVRVLDLPKATAIAAGYGKSCAVVEDGRVMCWGARESDPHSLLVDAKPASKPFAIASVQNAKSVTLGAYHGCALGREGAVTCFGANYFGQLGDGTQAASDVGVPVKDVEGAIAVAAGTHHTCALLREGNVWCWGADISGQLGAPAVRGGVRATAAKIDGVFRATSLAAGGDHTCVISDGKARCWGLNDRGQVATGAASVVRAPTVPAKIGSVSALAASDTHTCAIQDDGALACWGSSR